MTREDLKNLGIEEESINKIMALHGKDVNAVKAENEKTAAELEQARAELEKANATLEKVKDYDDTKAAVENYKKELEASKAEFNKKISQMELQGKIKDFAGNYKFVNDFTKSAIIADLEKALNDDANKGKSLEELFKTMTDGKENIFINENAPTPPVIDNMRDPQKQQQDSGLVAAFRKLNPHININS